MHKIFKRSQPTCYSYFVAYLRVVQPLLVALHAMAPHQIDWATGGRRVQTVVVRHDLVALRVGEHLIAAEAVAVAAAHLLIGLAAHCVQAVLRLDVLDLRASRKTGDYSHFIIKNVFTLDLYYTQLQKYRIS